MTEHNLFNLPEELLPKIVIPKSQEKNGLNSRDWKFYEFLEKGHTFKTNQEKLEAYEYWLLANYYATEYSYGYFEEKRANKHFSDMSSAREMRKTEEKLRLNGKTHKTITGKGLAKTKDEALTYLSKKQARALRVLKSYWTELRKLEQDHQMTFIHGQDRDYIEALVKEKS